MPFKRWIKTKINTKIPLAGPFYSMGERGVGLGITRSEGFLLYDAASNEWVQLPNKKYLSLEKENYISNYYKDKNENQYLFSSKKPVEVFDKGIKLATLDPDLFNSFTPPDVYTFAESAGGDVWVGTTMRLLQFKQ